MGKKRKHKKEEPEGEELPDSPPEVDANKAETEYDLFDIVDCLYVLGGYE